jgi:hypothetical protein
MQLSFTKKAERITRIPCKKAGGSAQVNILFNSHAILIKNIMCQESE